MVHSWNLSEVLTTIFMGGICKANGKKETMKLNVIKKKQVAQFNSGHLFWISFIVFFSIAGGAFLNNFEPTLISSFLIIICAIVPLLTNFYGNFEYFPVDYKVISQITLKPTSIKLEDREMEIDSISKIEIHVNDWHGKKIVNNQSIFGSGPKLSRGVNNKLTVYSKDANRKEISFQIESKQQFQKLANWIKSLYQHNIKVVENYEYLMSYGLEHLNYAEVQKFKRKYAS